MIKFKKTGSGIDDLVTVMAALRSPEGCPWDREQTHKTLRYHAVEEVYELIDAIETGDDHEMIEELGDLLLQVVFHCQLGNERRAFDLDQVARHITDKLLRRHPHVFGDAQAKTVEAVWTQWDKIKHIEKAGTRHERVSALDGIPRHLPALLRAEKLVKKARQAGLIEDQSRPKMSKQQLGAELLRLARIAQQNGWSAEELLRAELRQQERTWRQKEKKRPVASSA